MEAFLKSKRGGFAVFGVLCLLLVPAQAGVDIGPNIIVAPGGIEVPLLVNVLGPEEESDVDEVREIIHEANRIFQQANVQLSVARLYTGVTLGDGDRRIAAAEGGELLLGSLFELTGTPIPNGTDDEDSTDEDEVRRPHGLSKGVKLNIADDIWVEEPDRVYLDWGVLHVAFLERAGSPQEAARNLAYGLGLTLGVPGSLDPTNLYASGSTGTMIDPVQAGVIREGVRPIGLERSTTADGFAEELLWALRHGKNRGAVYVPEGHGWTVDPWGDVFSDHAGETGFGLGGVDLVQITALTGSPLTPIEDRHLTLKAALHTTDFPLSGGVDVYLSAIAPDDRRKSVDPRDFYSEAELIVGFGKGFAGYVKTGGDGQWNPLAGAITRDTVFGAFSLLQTQISYSDLRDAMSDDLFEALTNNGRVRFAATANAYSFDGTNVFFEDDATLATGVIKPVPKPLPTISPDARITGSGTGMPGFWGWAGKAANPLEITRENVHDIKHDFFAGAIPLSEQGTRIFEHVNSYDSGDDAGKFDSLNGFPNETFPGFDGPAMSPGNPADGDDDDNTGGQFIALGDFPAGLNVVGFNSSDNVGLRFLVGGTTVAHSFRGLVPKDDQGANGFTPPEGDENGDLARHVYAFNVPEAGRYAVHIQFLHTTGGASLELHDIRPNGECLLAGDTAGGGIPFEVPSQDIVDSVLAGGIINSPSNDDGGDATDGGTNGTPGQVVIDFEGINSFRPPFHTFGDQPWYTRLVDGSRVAQSGAITGGQATSLEATLDVGAGEIAFDYRVSSEANYDYLNFYLDGVLLQAWSGEEQGRASFPVGAGTHVGRWEYRKDLTGSVGQDGASIDNLTYPIL